MPSPKKAKGLFNENKTYIDLFCGKQFKGTTNCVLLKQRLHTKTCNLCKLAISQGNKQYTKKDFENLPKPGSVSMKVNPFSDYHKADEKAKLKNQIKDTVTICINPKDMAKFSTVGKKE